MNRAKVDAYNRDAVLARLMSGFGVTVVIQGDACPVTNGKTIVLPPLPIGADEIDTEIHDQGVSHEPAHITEGSFDTTRKASGFLHSIWNCIEDVRVENSQELSKYPGLRYQRAKFYEDFNRYVPRLGSNKALMASTKEGAVHGGLIRLLVEARAKQLGVTTNLKTSAVVDKFYRMTLAKYLDRVASLVTVDDAFNLAAEIYKSISGYAPMADGSGPDKSKPKAQGVDPLSGCDDSDKPNADKNWLEGASMPSLSEDIKAKMETSVKGWVPDGLSIGEIPEVTPDIAEIIKDNGIKILGVNGSKMTSLFTANSRPRTVRGRLDGRLDCRAVTEDHFDTRRELYSTRIKGATDKAAVEFLYDVSGSMCQRINDTVTIIHGIAHYLDRARIPFRVCAFDDNYYINKDWSDKWTGAPFLRTNCHVRGSTSMGMGVRASARSLMARPESKKVLIVLCDGEPDHSTRESTYCRETIKAMRSCGAVVIGIGIDINLSHIFESDSIRLSSSNMGPYLVERLTGILNRKPVLR